MAMTQGPQAQLGELLGRECKAFRFTIKPLATTQNSEVLSQALTSLDKFVGRGRIELEHFEMAGNYQLCADIVR
jgi:hypothetical protein